MIKQDSKSDLLFLQRLDELADRAAERYCSGFTGFLDGRNLKIAVEYLARYSDRIITVAYGGFGDAERKVVGVFPKDVYLNSHTDELISEFDITAVQIDGSGFSSFSHRDCMGSVLALGIKRETMGDIYVPDDGKSAYICLTDVVAQFLVDNLEFVARDKVKVKIIPLSQLPEPVKKFVAISGTVASERLDCIIALATNLSREKAKQLISAGLVNVNHFEETRCDIELCEGDILSVRGYGRFVLMELGGLTRKGRNRVVVHKMI